MFITNKKYNKVVQKFRKEISINKLKLHDKKYGRAYIHENRIFMNKLRWELKNDVDI